MFRAKNGHAFIVVVAFSSFCLLFRSGMYVRLEVQKVCAYREQTVTFPGVDYILPTFFFLYNVA